MLFEQGQTIPADCLIIEGSAVLNESILTGESLPVFKHQIDFAQIIKNQVLDCSVYAGTNLVDIVKPADFSNFPIDSS